MSTQDRSDKFVNEGTEFMSYTPPKKPQADSKEPPEYHKGWKARESGEPLTEEHGAKETDFHRGWKDRHKHG